MGIVIRTYFEKYGMKVPFTKANLRRCKVFLFHLQFNMVDVQFIKAIIVATLQAKWQTAGIIQLLNLYSRKITTKYEYLNKAFCLVKVIK